MIEVKDISKIFNKNKKNENRVLNNIAFKLPDSGLVAIHGKSGSGKTTLLNIIGGLDNYDSGQVVINGIDFQKNKDDIRNKEIGFIFQNYYLEEDHTVREILINQLLISNLYDKNNIEEKIDYYLDLVGLRKYKNRKSNSLSGGQKQRVAIARALIKEPSIILADEPTGNLDSKTTENIMQILKKISQDKLVVLVTHEENLIESYADLKIDLIDGQVHKIEQITNNDLKYDLIVNQNKSYEKTGKLFSIKNVIKKKEKKYNENIAKETLLNNINKIFIIFLALLSIFLLSSLFNIFSGLNINNTNSDKYIYTYLDSFNDIRDIDRKLYDSIDIYNERMDEGYFSIPTLENINKIDIKYIAKQASKIDNYELKNNEIIISSTLFNEINKHLNFKNSSKKHIIYALRFEEKYKVVKIIENEKNIIYFSPIDYANILGTYSNLKFNDYKKILFKKSNGSLSFKTKILSDNNFKLENDEVILQINRNSIYKILDDITEVDVIIDAANEKIKESKNIIQIFNSDLYVKNIEVIKNVNDNVDILVFVNQEMSKNISNYISPNNISVKNKKELFLELKTKDSTQFNLLKSELNNRKINIVNIDQKKSNDIKEYKNSEFKKIGIYLIIFVLLFLIYYLIIKSNNIKNIKNYGILRAIGVRKSNIIYRDAIKMFFGDLLYYFVAFTLSLIYLIIKLKFEYNLNHMILLIAFLVLTIVEVLIMIMALFSSILCLRKTPAEILAKYDI